MNDKNLIFYNNIGLDPFLELSEKGGFSACKDLDLISSYIKPNDSIVELGAGYGRCLNYFVARKHTGKLLGVEFSQPLFEHLKTNFNQNVELLFADIKTLKLEERYNIALWMWSGIIDFSPSEQLQCCKNISLSLCKGGYLFIDVPRIGVQTIANHIDSQHLVFKTEYGEINAYIPNDTDMEAIRSNASFESLSKIEYETATGKKRTIYILKK